MTRLKDLSLHRCCLVCEQSAVLVGDEQPQSLEFCWFATDQTVVLSMSGTAAISLANPCRFERSHCAKLSFAGAEPTQYSV